MAYYPAGGPRRGLLFSRLVADQAASNRPGAWTARRYGLLTVFSTFGSFYLLARNGDVLIDRDDGEFHAATAGEREFAHVQASRGFPQLRHLMPERPASAQTCSLCKGTGEVTVNDGRQLICGDQCNSRGWIVVS